MMDSDKEKTKKNAEFLEKILGLDEKQTDEKDVFSLVFSVDKDNVVDVIIEWPEKISEGIVDSAATLLFSVDKVQVQELIIQALTNALSSKECDISEASNKAMNLWAEYEANFKSKPCVSPNEVLKIKR